MQDSELIQRCRLGDSLAWEHLVEKFQRRIFGLALTYVHNREEARDLAQEIFVRVFNGLNQFKDDQAFVPWLLAMGRNCCIDRIRRLKVRNRYHTDMPEQAEFADPSDSPHDDLETSGRNKTLYKAIDGLSEQSREMIMLKDIQGLKFREISSMLGIPEGTVKSRSVKARSDLLCALKDQGYQQGSLT